MAEAHPWTWHFPETNACAWWLETGSKSSMGRISIHEVLHFQYRVRPVSNAGPPQKAQKSQNDFLISFRSFCVFVPFAALRSRSCHFVDYSFSIRALGGSFFAFVDNAR